MNYLAQEYINELIKLEPVFKKAGEMAVLMQKTAKSKNKFNTGQAGVDIVTEADHAVQEMILSEMAKTKLVECQLIAEEDTPLTKKFTGKNGLVLTLDPIDGTLLYSKGMDFFLTIVSLQDGKEFFYTFLNYPVFNWSRRITDKVEDFGKMPDIKINEGVDLSKIISYTVRAPKIIDQKIYNKILSEGYIFKRAGEIAEAGATTLALLGKTAGYYMETPNPYDGLVGLHYGKTAGFKIFSDIDLSKTHPTDHGPHYHGWYIILKK